MVNDENIDFKWAKLTKKAQKCIGFYIKTGEKEASYKKAFNSKNKKTLTVLSARFFKRPAVQAMIEYYRLKARESVAIPVSEVLGVAEKEAEAVNDTIIDAAWVLKRAALLANFNIKKFIRIEPKTQQAVYDFSQATDDDWYCINEYTTVSHKLGELDIEVQKVKIKSEAKIQALKLVGSHTQVKAWQGEESEEGAKQVADVLQELISKMPD